ncbi:CAP domain-containing protein [Brevibacillus sp. TJ4]|uniref:CAP domain-containing protein n=1 Tax=Brevibacillus sp. TJ4 TaxID=3234853 RepID=UPI0037CF3370
MRKWFLLAMAVAVILGANHFFKAEHNSLVRAYPTPTTIYWDGREIGDSIDAATGDKAGQTLPTALEYEGNLYVPLSLIGEQLNKPVGWDRSAAVAWLGQAPAEALQAAEEKTDATQIPGGQSPFGIPGQATAEQQAAEPKTAAASSTGKARQASTPVYELFGLRLGMTSQQVLDVHGKPARVEPSGLGYEWWIYNQEPARYLQVGIAQDRVVDLYSNAPSAKLGNTGIGASLQSLQSQHPLQDVLSLRYMGAHIQITNQKQQRPLVIEAGTPLIYYLDLQNDNKVTALRMIDIQMLLRGGFYEMKWTYQGKAPDFDPPSLSVKERELVNAAYERQVLDLVNVVRYRYKLPPLTWHEGAAEVARGHSLDMKTNQFFDHVSATSGLDPFERLKAADIRYIMAGENIAAGYPDAIEVHEGWMNSPGHRKNVLEKDFALLGVGVVSDYYTQAFLTLPDE